MSFFIAFSRYFALALTLVFSFFATQSSMAQSAVTGSQSPGQLHIEYHFPMDGSTYVPTHSSIILRPNVTVDPSAMVSAMKITGALSGLHSGTIVRSDDNRTLIFTPSVPFNLGEKVTVVIQNSEGISMQPISFSFNVSPSEPIRTDDDAPYVGYPNTYAGMVVDTIVPPSDFPTMQVVADDNPTAGDLLLTTFNFNTKPMGNYRMIIDSLARPIYAQIPANGLDWDFKILPNGKLAFCEGGYAGNTSIIASSTKYYIMDSNFVIVDSFATQTDSSQYTTDFHDFEMLQNGHVLMLGQAILPNYDMSKYVKGGLTTATFLAAVVEELDTNKRPVWIWRTWDPGHYLDTDATNDPFTEQQIDAVHANAIMQDTDGNILLSARSMDEITKINRSDTGSMIWRLGGKHNQFTFINDSIKFSHQHDVRRIANGDITLFDNGNFGHSIILPDTIIDSSFTPPDTSIDLVTTKYSRACEYNLDIPNKTATLAWHYDHDSTVQSQAMGYVQRFDNGNTLINWGLNVTANGVLSNQPAVTEVTKDGIVAYELHINTPYAVYRAEKFAWNKPTSGVAGSAAVSNNLTLGQPFPNPSNGTSRVVFAAPPYEPVQLELYDALGRMVQSYYNGIAGGPLTPLELDTKGLPDGSYQLVLRGSSGIVTRQLIIMQ